jgi:predicted RNase H-like nuclease (RuvC/YqgF family)
VAATEPHATVDQATLHRAGGRREASAGTRRVRFVGADGHTDLLTASDRLLTRERSELHRSIDALTARVEVFRGMLEQLEVELANKQRLLREIEELTDRRPQLRLERLDRQLKGRRLQEVAVEILRQRAGDGAVVHYREWFGWLRAEGYEVSGRDPLNTFLTSVGRAGGVERVGMRTGMYRLARPA